MKRLALLLVAFLLVACGSEAPAQGYVRDKHFEPEHQEYRGQRCVSYNAKGACTVSIPDYVTVDDTWTLYLENCHVDQGKQKCDRGWREVDHATYDRFQVGQHYPDPR